MTRRLAVGLCGALWASQALSAELVIGNIGPGVDFSFADVNNAAQSENVVAASTVELDTVMQSLPPAGDLSYAAFYRGATGLDANRFWIEASKDDFNQTGVSVPFDSNVDECVQVSDLDTLIAQVGTRNGDVYQTDAGNALRIGPHPSSGSAAVTSFGTGESYLPAQWGSTHRASQLTFLTTGTHADDSDDVSSVASYNVVIDYVSGSDDLFTIEIPRDNNAATSMSSSSSGDDFCQLGSLDSWCFAPHDTVPANSNIGATDCDCDGIFGSGNADRCWILEVQVEIDAGRAINDIQIAWVDYEEGTVSVGLNGPMAVTLEIDEPSYEELFLFSGTYWSTILDAGGHSAWYNLSWDQSNSNGEMWVAFDCGDAANGSDFTAGDWGDVNAQIYPFRSNADSPSFEIAATVAGDSNYDQHCAGRYADFQVFLLDPYNLVNGDSPPQLDEVVLQFSRDADMDLFMEQPYPGGNPNPDCDDNDGFTYPGAAFNDDPAACMTDADGDGWGAMNPAAGVTPGRDCNDNSPGVTNTIYYADCDNDGFGDPMNRVLACSEPTDMVCANGMAPPVWLTGNASDCDDENDQINPDAFEVCDGADNDCDNLVDDQDPSVIDQIEWCEDSDMDGFGNFGVSIVSCNMPAGFVMDCTDCDDGSNAVGGGCVELIYRDSFEFFARFWVFH